MPRTEPRAFDDAAPLLYDATRMVWRAWEGIQPTGIDRVCLAYLAHYGDRAQAMLQHNLIRRIAGVASSRRLFALLSAPGPDFRRRFAAWALTELAARPRDGGSRFCLNVGHTGLDRPGLARWYAANRVRPIHFIHDLIPITHPQYCRAGEKVRHVRRTTTALETAAGIIVNSRDTGDVLEGFAQAQGLAMPPTLASWLGTIELPRPAQSADASDQPYFVVLGTIEGRKNHLLLLEVWRRLAARLGASAPRLLVIGRRGWSAQPAFDLLDQPALFAGTVKELGDCDDAALTRMLAGARALLFPSFAEGYGMPLMEALSAGVPVIASDINVFREIGQGVPELLGTHDAAAWEAAVLAYSAPDESAQAGGRRKAQMQRLTAFRPPTWDDHFRDVDGWLATLAG